MTRRITIPEDHVAVILPSQLADELMSMAKTIRSLRKVGGEDSYPYRQVAGDLMLALLEAKEA